MWGTALLDIDLIRNNPDLIRESLKNRNYSEKLLDDFLTVDEEWRKAVDDGNRLKHERNDASSRIPNLKGDEKQKVIAEMKQVSEKIKELDALKIELELKREDIALNIPNVPDKSVPVGKDYDGNKVVMAWGTPKKFDFEPKKHYELGEDLDIIDFVRGAKITGSGFHIMKGDGARLERAVIQYMLDAHHEQGYTEIIPPAIINKNAVIGTGQYPKMKEDMYWCERDDLWLNPTAEVPVTNMHQDEIFEKADLPKYYTAYLPSFRREAGRNADTRGIIRVHQFNKIELVEFVLPQGSMERLETLRGNAEAILRGLELPYRVLLLCTGDMGFASAKTYDLEAYAPAADQWLEVSSCSCFTDFQARRARIKYRPEPHLKSEFVNTLNGSGLALPRTIVAIMENYQTPDGKIVIPEVLRPYMKGQKIIG